MFNLKKHSQFQNQVGELSGALPALDKAVTDTDRLLNNKAQPDNINSQDSTTQLTSDQQAAVNDSIAKNSWDRVMMQLNQLSEDVIGAVRASPEFQTWEQKIKNRDTAGLNDELSDLGVEGTSLALESTDDVTSLEQKIINRARSINKALVDRQNQQAANTQQIAANNEQQIKQAQQSGLADFVGQYIDVLLSYNGEPGTAEYSNAKNAVEEIRSFVSPALEEEANSILEAIIQMDITQKNKAEELLIQLYNLMISPAETGEIPISTASIKMNKETTQSIPGIVGFNLDKHILNNQPMTKTAADHFGMPYVLYGPTEKRICPKLRGKNMGDVVSESICRFHCLDGIVIDDNKTICGEALWRANVMDKFSREYVDEDGKTVGGYLNKRFEINRNVPEESKMRLKPGETRKPRPLSQGNLESRLQDMRNKEGEKRNYRPNTDTSKPFNWTKDIDQNNVEVSQSERNRREKDAGHQIIETANEKIENKPEISKEGFNLKKHKTAQTYPFPGPSGSPEPADLGFSNEITDLLAIIRNCESAKILKHISNIARDIGLNGQAADIINKAIEQKNSELSFNSNKDSTTTEGTSELETVHILYPENRLVPAEQIISWATDAFIDGEANHMPQDIYDAVDILSDLGTITVAKGWDKKPNHPFSRMNTSDFDDNSLGDYEINGPDKFASAGFNLKCHKTAKSQNLKKKA